MSRGIHSQKRRKHYPKLWIPALKKRVKLHRHLAAQYLGRPLLAGEVVHHRDGDCTNNSRENLVVLPSQAYHAHLEYHLRREKLGMPCLFPELFRWATGERRGTLFEHVSL